MAPRAYWTGHIRLSLVSFPVRLYAAVTSAKDVTLHQVHAPSGERIRYQKVVADHGPVEPEEIVKGYEYEKGHYVLLDDDELDKLKVESRHTIDLVQFVAADGLDPIYFEKPYFVAPDGDLAEEAFVVVREALRRSGKVALGQIVLSGKERIAALRPCGRGMVLETLRYAEEVRRASEFFDEIDEIEVDEEQLALAVQLIEAKSARFDPTKFEDHYQKALKQLIADKVRGRAPKKAGGTERRERGNVVNLMDALKRSVAQSAPAPSGKSAPAKRGGTKSGTARKPAAKKRA